MLVAEFTEVEAGKGDRIFRYGSGRAHSPSATRQTCSTYKGLREVRTAKVMLAPNFCAVFARTISPHFRLWRIRR
jgi:hypothetical protein